MFQTKRLTIIACSIALLALGITACASKVDRSTPYPSPTMYVLPTEEVLTAPTFTPGPLFDCWTAPAPQTPVRGNLSGGKLLLAFAVYRSSDEANVYQYDLTSQHYSLLIPHVEEAVRSPVSPDGRYLSYLLYARPANVAFVYNFATETPRQVPFPALFVGNYSPNWSPDSQCLFVWGKEHATAYRLMDGALQERTFPDIDFSRGYMVATSMDGRWWAWSCEKSVCLMNPDAQATGPTKLALPVIVAPSPDPNTAYYNPSMLWWSPDSQVLAIAYPGRDWQYRDALRLAVIDQNGVASFQDVVSGKEGGIDEVRWSPDSSQMLITYLSGKTDLYNLRTGRLMPLPSPKGYPRLSVAPAWSPTGKQIAFVAQDQRSLYVMNADGTNVAQIPSLPPDAPGADALAPDFRTSRVFWAP